MVFALENRLRHNLGQIGLTHTRRPRKAEHRQRFVWSLRRDASLQCASDVIYDLILANDLRLELAGKLFLVDDCDLLALGFPSFFKSAKFGQSLQRIHVRPRPKKCRWK